jgi:hypothetical protein
MRLSAIAEAFKSSVVKLAEVIAKTRPAITPCSQLFPSDFVYSSAIWRF